MTEKIIPEAVHALVTCYNRSQDAVRKQEDSQGVLRNQEIATPGKQRRARNDIKIQRELQIDQLQ